MIIIFFFNAPATTEIYTLSLHDALPIFLRSDVEPISDRRRLRVDRRRYEQRRDDAPHRHRDRGHDRGTFRRASTATRQELELRPTHDLPPALSRVASV